MPAQRQCSERAVVGGELPCAINALRCSHAGLDRITLEDFLSVRRMDFRAVRCQRANYLPVDGAGVEVPVRPPRGKMVFVPWGATIVVIVGASFCTYWYWMTWDVSERESR